MAKVEFLELLKSGGEGFFSASRILRIFPGMRICCEKDIPCKIILSAILLLCFIYQGCTGEKDTVLLSHDFTKKTMNSIFQITDYWDFSKCTSYVGKGWSSPQEDEDGEYYVVSQKERAFLTLYAAEKKDLAVSLRCGPFEADNRQRSITITINRTQLAAIDMAPGSGITSYSFLIPGESLVLGSNSLVFSFKPGEPGTPLNKRIPHRDISIKLYDICFGSEPDRRHVFTDCVQDRITHIAYVSRFTINGDQKIGIAQYPKSAVVFDKCYIPPHSFLKFYLGFHPRVKKRDLDVIFSVFVKEYAVEKPDSGTIIFSETLNLEQLKNNRWKAFEIDFSRFAGKVLSISFNIRADVDPYTVLAMWGEPRFVSRETGPKYNVILITMDAMRADFVGCYGFHKKLTPNIDRFSNDAVMYQKCFSPAPWTLPSFASYYTSLYPKTHEARAIKTKANVQVYVPLEPTFPTPPTFFEPYNYSTHLITWHPFFREKHGLSRGFDHIDTDDVNRLTPFYIDTVKKWIKWVEKDKFFLHIHIIPPHCPYIAASPYDETHIDFNNPFLKNKNLKFYYSPSQTNFGKRGRGIKNPDIRNYISALYKANVALSDEFFGEIILQLKKAGLYENSLIIFSSDHGEQLWEHNKRGHCNSLYAEVLHVPLLIKFPGALDIAHREVKSPVSTIDILPTMLEVNNMPVPGYFHGEKLFSLKTGGLVKIERRYLYLSLGMPDLSYEGLMWHDYKYIYSPVSGTEELYKISTDPFEKTNIAAGEPDVLKKLRNALKKFVPGMYKTGKQKKKEEVKDKEGVERPEKLRTLGYL